MFREELYNKINGTKEDIDSCIHNLTDVQRQLLIEAYGVNSKIRKGNNKKIILSILQKHVDCLYKKNVYKEYSGYSREDVYCSFSNLKLSQKQIFLKVYTFTEEKEKREPLSEIEKEKLRYIRSKFELFLSNIKNNIVNYGRKSMQYKSLESILNSDLVTIKKIMTVLSEFEQSMIYKKYGNDLNDLTNKNLLDEENRYIGTILIKKMKRILCLLENGYEIYNLYGLLDTNEIDISLLNEKDKDKLYKIFGKNLDKGYLLNSIEKENFFFDKDCLTIQRKLLKQSVKTKKDIKSFFALFEDCKKENETQEEFEQRVKETLKKLKEENLKIIYKKYGEDLKSINSSTKYETKDFFRHSYYLIKYYLNKEEPKPRKFKTLFERLNAYGTHKEILIALAYLTDEEKDVLRKYFGFTLNARPEQGMADSDAQDLIKSVIDKTVRIIIKNKSNETHMKIITLKNIRKLTLTDEFKELSKYYDENILLAYFIKKVYPTIPNQKIYSLTQVDVENNEQIREISERVLNLKK